MLSNGDKLDGRYLLEKEIGSGGFGAVYLATDTRFSGNNKVAIKQILLNNEQGTKLFRQEADLLYNLSHPNLPKVTNCFQENDANFIVMEYVSGEDLAVSLKKGKQFTIEETLAIADKVLDALEYLHSFLIFHRDIKPHNIKINENGKIYLLDFGTAKGNVEETNMTQFGGQSLTGFTPFYAPLEQVLRVDPNSFLLLRSLDSPHLDEFLKRKTDERSDIYSLGATLYHLLTAHSSEKATSTVRAFSIWSGRPDPLPPCNVINPEISEGLANIIHRCLEIVPEKRFQKASDLRRALNDPQTAVSSPKISEQLTITFQPDSNPAINISNPSLQPTAVFLSDSFSKSAEPTGEKITAPSVEITGKSEVSPTLEANPTAVLSADSLPIKTLPPFESTVSKSPIEPAKSPSKSRLPIYLAASAAFIFLLVVSIGGWFALKNSTAKVTAIPAEKVETVKTETSAPPMPVNLRSLSYFLSVQKMRDGKPFQEPFQSSGQEIFENGYRFQLYFSLPEEGYFYAFAEGLDKNGGTVFNILFPTPKSNDGSAKVAANHRYETGQNQFEGSPGTENFWIVWSKDNPAVAETARADAFNHEGTVSDGETRKQLKSFLENAAKNETDLIKDSDQKATHIEFTGDSAAHLIRLEHR